MFKRPGLCVTGSAITNHAHAQTEITVILLPQLIATLNNYAVSLPPLAHVN